MTPVFAALMSGVLLGAAFLRLHLEFVAWLAFVPLFHGLDTALRRGDSLRRLFLIGAAFGLVFYLIGVHWIALLSNVAITVPWLKYPAWLLAGAYLSCFAGLTAVLAGALVRHGRLSLAWAMPLAVVVVEELRASGEMGFPWFQPGYTQHAYVPVLALASWGGVMLVTVWVMAVNALAWRSFTTRNAATITALVMVFALPWIAGWPALRRPLPTGPPVGLIQGNIPGEIKWGGKHQPEILAAFLELSERAAHDPAAPKIVIWPETATGSYLRRQIDQALAVTQFAVRTGVSVFSGLAHYDVGDDGTVRYQNAGTLFRADAQPSPVYAKRHLVPFGERMPFQWLIPAIGTVDLGQAEWTPGTDPVLFEGGTGRFGCLVCFESIFPDLARDDVRRGATWLVNITNDEWFGNSVALDQHAAMAVFRAAENHVPLARCANTGITMMVDARGRVIARAKTWEAAVLVAPLDRAGPTTPFTRWGDWPGAVCALAVAGILAAAAARALTARRRAA